MKKLTIIAALAMATAAFAIPSTASAIWTDNHAHIQAGNNPQVDGEGTVGFKSSGGDIDCTEVYTAIQLTGGQTTGHVQAFQPTNPATTCHTEGAIGHCTLTSVQPTGLWQAHINGTTGVQVKNIHIHNDLHGFLCPDLTIHLNDPMDFIELTGEEPGNTGAHTTIQGIDVEGTVTATPIGTVQVSGTITPTPAQSGKYGWT
jgi:hypothetical protein